MTKQQLLDEQKRIAAQIQQLEQDERQMRAKEEMNHEFPAEFPFHADDYDEVIMGYFLHSEYHDENGNVCWDDCDEAKRRWEAFPRLVELLNASIDQPDSGSWMEAVELLVELGERKAVG
jgi:hypothetical protein